jgi:hypothetical protein
VGMMALSCSIAGVGLSGVEHKRSIRPAIVIVTVLNHKVVIPEM